MKANVHHADNWSTDRARFVYISWLYAQDYCEYQIHLEQVQGVTTDDTPEMIEGSEEHSRLEEEFAAEATLDLTFPEAIEASKEKPISTREIYVQDSHLQICGYIDELVMKPDEFVVIDDKPVGRSGKVYPSSKNQVFGYCIALKNMLSDGDNRKITAAVRERGTDRIVWSQSFDTRTHNRVIKLVDRIHGILNGDIESKASDKGYKCRPCRFFDICDRKVVS